MWYEERGVGDPVVLLHPGGVDARAWGPNLDAFAARFRVFTPDRRGHGHTPDVAGPLTYELMAQDTVAFLEDVVGAPAHLVGCSDGAIVALHTALRRPDLVDRVALVAAVFNREGWVPGAADLDEETSAYFAAAYGEVSPDGPDHYPIVADKLARMHAHEPTLTAADLAGVPNRALVMVGDDDQVILEHAIAYYRGLPNAELAVIPGTSHGLLVEKTTLCNTIIIDFLANEPVPTLAPIRRASTADR